MSYKIPTIPAPRAHTEEIADFWEIQAIRNPGMFISQNNISKTLSHGLDEKSHEGIISEDDEIDESLNPVFEELRQRSKFTRNKYPFDNKSYSIKYSEDETTLKKVYLFMLLCTRFNMSEQKIKDGVDATEVFEELCSYVIQKYFGNKSKSFVFGTAVAGGFEAKTKDLIRKIGEGVVFTNPDNNTPNAKDDAVDVVAWVEFGDERIGKLIVFGQCKTGTTWRDDIKKLNPENFCKKWFAQYPIYTPLRLVFLCDTMNYEKNFYSDQLGFLIFNRFRIMEYIEDDFPNAILGKIDTWLASAVLELNILN